MLPKTCTAVPFDKHPTDLGDENEIWDLWNVGEGRAVVIQTSYSMFLEKEYQKVNSAESYLFEMQLISFDFFQHILGNYFCYIIKLDVLTCMNMDPMTLPLCMEKELVPTRSPPLGFRQNPVSMEKIIVNCNWKFQTNHKPR